MNYDILKEYVLEVSPKLPALGDFETAFLLLSISLNLHGETVYHMRGGKGKAREARLHELHCVAVVLSWQFYMGFSDALSVRNSYPGMGPCGGRPLPEHAHTPLQDHAEGGWCEDRHVCVYAHLQWCPVHCWIMEACTCTGTVTYIL